MSDLALLDRYLSRLGLEQIGTKREKLEQDSPRRHAAELAMPLLIIHGDRDAQANLEQSSAMDDALRAAHKLPEFIVIKGADHQMTRESDHREQLSSIEKFLAINLGPGVKAR